LRCAPRFAAFVLSGLPVGRAQSMLYRPPPGGLPVPFDFLIRRDDLRRTEVRETPAATDLALAPGQALLAVDAFAFTANNVTYAVFGDALRYWEFFPAPEGYGRVPVWGFATVARSAHPALGEGERIWGYLPMSTHFAVEADKVTAGSFHDAAAHRRPMSAFYNQYLRVAADPGYDPAREAEQMLFRPLFATAFLLDDFLAGERFFEAEQVVISCASSKTSMALAAQLRARGACRVVGLTAVRNVAFVSGLGAYDAVYAYDAIEALPVVRSVFVDMAGDLGVTTEVHRHLGASLAYSCAVGGTHWDHSSFGKPVPGPAPVFFFAPDQMTKRIGEVGSAEMQRRLASAWGRFLPLVDRSIEIERASGPEAFARVYLATLEGRADPRKGNVLAPGA